MDVVWHSYRDVTSFVRPRRCTSGGVLQYGQHHSNVCSSIRFLIFWAPLERSCMQVRCVVQMFCALCRARMASVWLQAPESLLMLVLR